MNRLIGYFDSPEQKTPKHDPGLNVECLVCMKILSRPVVTISLMLNSPRNRSCFFRAHKTCWDGLSVEEQAQYEGGIIDREISASRETPGGRDE